MNMNTAMHIERTKARIESRRQERYDAHYYMGIMQGVTVTSVLIIIYAALTQQSWLVPMVFIPIVLASLNTLIFRRVTMYHIKKVLGINVIEMKMKALADYIKVNFIHVPEHYKCEKK